MKRTLLLALSIPKNTLRLLIIVIALALALGLLAASGAQRKAGVQAETAQPQPTPSPCPPYTRVNADDARNALIKGNLDRWTRWGSMKERNWDHERDVTATCQNPFAVVVTCMDSRVPPELIFDQDLGALFVIRVAGPVLNDDEKASLEYALDSKKIKFVLVLGHTDCGAVKGAVDRAKGVYLPKLLAKIEDAITEVSNNYNNRVRIDSKNPINLNRVSIANARLVAQEIPVFGQVGVKVTWGLYNTRSGLVTFEAKQP